MKFSKHLLALAVSATLIGCGSGGSSSTTPTSGSQAQVSGTATKGVMLGADVEVLRHNGTDFVSFSPAITAVTSTTDGSYSVTLPAGYTGITKVTVTANASTLMKCDVSNCGAGNSFGDNISLPVGFSMDAILSDVTGSQVTVNPNPLTHMAAKLAENGSTLDVAAINAASENVRQDFNVPGDSIYSFTPLDITNPAAVNGADNTALQIAMMSAAIISAAQGADGSLDFTQALSLVTNDFVGNNGKLLKKDTDSTVRVSLDDILDSFDASVTRVKQKAQTDGITLSNASLDSVEALLNAEKQTLASLTASDTVLDDDNVPSVAVDATDIEKAKALFTDLRNLNNAANSNSSSSSNILSFALFEKELENILAPINAPELADMLTAAEMAVAGHSAQGGTINVNQTYNVGGQNFAVVAAVTAPRDLSQATNASITGSITHDNLVLTINEGSVVNVTAASTPQQGGAEQGEATIGSSSLKVVLEKKSSPAAKFTGELNISGSISANYTKSPGSSSFTRINAQLQNFALRLSGTFEKGTDAVSATVDATNLVANSSYENNQENTSVASGRLSLSLSTNIPALSNQVTVAVVGNVQSDKFQSGSMSLSYEGIDLLATLATQPQNTVTVSNQNGITVDVTEVSKGTYSGAVKAGSEQIGTITENGFVRYTNGDFESVF